MTSRVVVLRKPQGKVALETGFLYTEADVRAIAARSAEPDWLLERRLLAWRTFVAPPMPTIHDEAWRRTDINDLPARMMALRPADDLAVDGELLQPLVGEGKGAMVVIRPGLPTQTASHAELKAKGVAFLDWKTAVAEQGELLRRVMSTVVPPSEGKFAALATALAHDGVVVVIPSGVELEAPLHSIFWSPGTHAGFFSRVLVVLGERASCTFVHETASPTEANGAALHAGIVELSLAPDSRLTFVELQNWGQHVWNFTHERAKVERDAKLNWIFGAVGSHLTKNFTELTLEGRGAE